MVELLALLSFVALGAALFAPLYNRAHADDGRQIPKGRWFALASVLLFGGVLVAAVAQAPTSTGGGGGAPKITTDERYQVAVKAAEDGDFSSALRQLYLIPRDHRDYPRAQAKIREYKQQAKVELQAEQRRADAELAADRARQQAERRAADARLASQAAPGFFEIRNNMEKFTSVQFDSYVDSLKGKKVRWTGRVHDVRKRTFGGYEVSLDMDQPGDLSISDIRFEVTEQIADQIEKGHTYSFTGEIESIRNVLGACRIKLNNAEFVD